MRKPIHFHHFPQNKKVSFFETLKKISEPITVISKIGLFVGLILLLFYFAQNSFIPVVSFQDTFLLVFVVLAFAFVAAVSLLYSAVAWLWLFWIVIYSTKGARLNWSKAYKDIGTWQFAAVSLFVGLLFSLFFISLYLAYPAKFNHYQLPQFIMGFLGASFFILFLYGIEWPTKTKGTNQQVLIWALSAVLLLMLVILGSPSALLNFTMLTTSIRQHNVAVELNEKDYQDLAAKADLYGFKPKVCQLPDGYLVSDVDLIWHGVGSKTRFVIYKEDSKNNDLFELPFTFNSDNLSVVNAKNKMDEAVCIKP